MPVMQK